MNLVKKTLTNLTSPAFHFDTTPFMFKIGDYLLYIIFLQKDDK